MRTAFNSGLVSILSVFGRIGAVIATLGDYASSLIVNDSKIGSTTLKSSLNTLLTLTASEWAYQDNRGVGFPQSTTVQNYIHRKNDFTTTDVLRSEFPVGVSGTFTFTVNWKVAAPLLIDSMIMQIFKNGVATGVSGVILPNTTSGQFSGPITVAVGDGLAMGLLQSGTEAQPGWLLSSKTIGV